MPSTPEHEPRGLEVPPDTVSSNPNTVDRRSVLKAGFAALLLQALPVAPAEAQENAQERVDVSFEGDPKKHIPLSIHINVGKETERMVELSVDRNVPIELPIGEHTIDVRPVTQGEKAPTYRIEVDGKRSPIQASPNTVSVKTGQRVRLVIEEPITTTPKLPTLSLADTDPTLPQARLEMRESGSFHLPYIVEVLDAEGKVVHSLQSKPDGSLPEALPELAPGNVHIRVRPVRLHYPLTSSTSLRGKTEVVGGVRTTNHSVVPIEAKAGQTIVVDIAEGIESYNQVQGSFGGMQTLVLLNRPYAHENLGVDPAGKPTFMPSETDQYPNAIVALHALGADPASGEAGLKKACRALALQLAEGLQTEIGKRVEDSTNNAPIEVRRNHTMILIACDREGKVPTKVRNASKEEIATYIEGEILRMLAKPHRTSDALGVQEYAHADTIDGKPNESKIEGFPAPKPRHMSKLDTLREVGPEYAKRWENLSKK